MPNLDSVAELLVFVRPTLPGGFRDRLVVTILATVLDLGAIVIAGPTAFACGAISLLVPVVFSILTVALLAVLGYMWLLTFRSWTLR